MIATRLTTAVSRAYDLGHPGGWWVIAEPELHFLRDQEVLVPDIAAWKRAQLPDLPADQRFEVVPDWICDVRSPSTAGMDRNTKMRVYARYGVAHAWLANPMTKTLQAFRLRSGEWELVATFASGAPIQAAPFDDISVSPPWV